MASQAPVKDEAEKAWHVDFTDDSVKPWAERTGGEKVQSVIGTTLKIAGVLLMLYLFICSLSFLATGFRLVAGKQAGKVFGESEIFNNPVSGLMVGVLVTVLVQSSSTSTSITITMVAAGLLTVKQAIPIIMGANIGTSVTSTIVALGQAADRDEFRRSFAAATVHDMFNFLSVAVLLPVEAATGFLYNLSTGIVDGYDSLTSQEKPPDILKVITKPFTKAIIQIDKKIINKLAEATPGSEEYEELEAKSLLKKPKTCDPDPADAACAAADDAAAGVVCAVDADLLHNETACEAITGCEYTEAYDPEDCSDVKYMFEGMYGSWSDTAAGWLILIIALFILCVCLMGIVKTLRSLLKGRVAVWLHATVNGDVPCGGVLGKELAGLLRILAGFGLTICVQSSSITTSALTPLVGVGVIELEAMYPAVLGANIGTTVTGMLAALAADGEKLKFTLAVAYSHLFFNITGIILFYGIWPMRKIPIGAAKALGNITATYRWFPIFYIIFMFMIVPTIFVLLSMASTVLAVIVFLLVVVVVLFVATVTHFQNTKPDCLPESLKTWDALPIWMRSLEPYDRLCCCCCPKPAADPVEKDPEQASA
eukprot:COSAG02_NODE_1073_length_14776_cov_6.711930_12_plen_596_part_00